MKTLIIHHLETEWERGYRASGTSFENLCEQFIDHIENNDYDRIILTRWEDYKLSDCHYETGIAEHITEVHNYSYGWDRDCLEDGGEYCDGGYHSQYVLIANWMRTLKGEIYISGAFDGECIEDLEIALQYLNIDFKRIEDLIVKSTPVQHAYTSRY